MYLSCSPAFVSPPTDDPWMGRSGSDFRLSGTGFEVGFIAMSPAATPRVAKIQLSVGKSVMTVVLV